MSAIHHLKLLALTVILACLVPFGLLQASDFTTTVHFKAGRDNASYSGRIEGYDTARFYVGARRGQAIGVKLRASNKQAFFNVLPPNSSEAVFNGSVSGNSYRGILPDSGDYVIEVYLMRAAARRGESSGFSIDIVIPASGSGSAPAVEEDFADGNSGGPDNWIVSGVASNDRLNVRNKPSADAPVVGRLRNGAVVRNLGCRSIGKTRWCRISARGEGGSFGWTNGRYLIEAGQPVYHSDFEAVDPSSYQQHYAEDGQVHDTKCKVTSTDCIRKAQKVCGGEFRTIHSESHAGGLAADTLPGPVIWYYLEYQCGFSDGRWPQFSFRGPHFTQEFNDGSSFDAGTFPGSISGEARMRDACKGAAALAFGQRASRVLVLPVERSDSGYLVYGQYPDSGPNVKTFYCKFNEKGVFRHVRRS